MAKAIVRNSAGWIAPKTPTAKEIYAGAKPNWTATPTESNRIKSSSLPTIEPSDAFKKKASEQPGTSAQLSILESNNAIARAKAVTNITALDFAGVTQVETQQLMKGVPESIGPEIAAGVGAAALAAQVGSTFGAEVAVAGTAALASAAYFLGKSKLGKAAAIKSFIPEVLNMKSDLGKNMASDNYSGYGPGFDIGDVFALALPGFLEDNFGVQGGTVRKKIRRMDPANAKAAARAGRRIKGTLKLLHSIERKLPHRKAPAVKAGKCCK